MGSGVGADFQTLRLLKRGFVVQRGRLTLLKATLASIHNYYLSLFTILASVAVRIESVFCKFLWNDMEDHYRYHLVNWKTNCLPMDCGGLGVKSIKSHNKVFLVKWLWRFGFREG